MKLGLIAAATLAAVALPTVAPAQTVVTRTTTVHHDEHVRGPVIVRHNHRRKVCTVKWNHHRKIRRCFWR